MAAPESRELDHRSIERRAWALACSLLAATLFFHSPAVSVGAGAGAFLAILNYRWLRAFVVGITSSRQRPSKGAILLYTLKYFLTGVALFALIAYDLADVVALLAGISVIFLAICWEGIRLHGT